MPNHGRARDPPMGAGQLRRPSLLGAQGCHHRLYPVQEELRDSQFISRTLSVIVNRFISMQTGCLTMCGIISELRMWVDMLFECWFIIISVELSVNVVPQLF